MIKGMRRRLVPIVVLAMLALALSAGTATAALKAIHLRGGGVTQALTAGIEGKLWIAGVDDRGTVPTDFVGWLAPDGEVKSYSVETPAGTAGIGALTPGPGGQMWFTVPGADRIGRIDAAGAGAAFPLPAGSRPTGLVATPGLLWSTLEGTAQITSLSPEASTTMSWGLGRGGSAPEVRPAAMVLGSDNELWALQAGSSALTRMTLQGARSSIFLQADQQPGGAGINSDLAAGDDGAIWVGQRDRATIGRLVPSPGGGQYTGYRLPGGPTTLLSPGPAGDIWFADTAGRIGSIAPDGEVGELACAVKRCADPVTALGRGPEGDLWFAAGRLVAPFRPPALTLKLTDLDGTVRAGDLSMQIRCRGGAGSQDCPGRIELLHDGRRLVGSPYRALTGSDSEVTVPVGPRTAKLLAARGRLRVALVLSVAGKSTDRRVFTLRAAS
jgi:streptogramin lyase